MQITRCFWSKLTLAWKYGKEYGRISMEWKIFIREWKNISSMEYGKIILHSISYHALPTASKLDVQ